MGTLVMQMNNSTTNFCFSQHDSRLCSCDPVRHQLNHELQHSKKSTRHVRFLMDSNKDDQVAYVESTPSLTEEDHKNCWWSSQEIGDMCRDAKRAANTFRDHEGDSIREFDQFFRLCSLSTSKCKRILDSARWLSSLQQRRFEGEKS